MINIIKANDRFFSDMGKMNSYFLFSFAHYFDKNNESFGNIRVFNDDFLFSYSGFDMHPHKYYEIMTIMLEGTITHRDNLGNNIKIKANQIQVTNTANGIMHSEINEENQNIRLYQIWFSPENIAGKPIYYTANFEEKDFLNNLFTIASGINENKNILSSKVDVKRGIFDMGKTIKINFEKYIFIYITSGKIEVNGVVLNSKDQLRAFSEKELIINILEKSDFIIIESE